MGTTYIIYAVLGGAALLALFIRFRDRGATNSTTSPKVSIRTDVEVTSTSPSGETKTEHRAGFTELAHVRMEELLAQYGTTDPNDERVRRDLIAFLKEKGVERIREIRGNRGL